MSPTTGLVTFIVGLVLSIALHEAGHLIVARWAGMRADRFFVGFGPTLWSFRRGEVEYGVKAILAGGFVKINGMVGDRGPFRGPVWHDLYLRAAAETEDDEEPEPTGLMDAHERTVAALAERGVRRVDIDRVMTKADLAAAADPEDAARRLRQALEAVVGPDDDGKRGLWWRLEKGDVERLYASASRPARFAAILAGPATNFLIAFVLFVGIAAYLGVPAGSPFITAVLEDNPAAAAGVEVGDKVIAIDGEPVDYESFNPTLRAAEPGLVSLTVERDGEALTLPVDLAPRPDDPAAGYLGVQSAAERLTRAPWPVLREATVGDWSMQVAVVSVVEPLFTTFGDSVAALPAELMGDEERSEQSIVSLVGIGRDVTTNAESYGWLGMLLLFGFLNVLLGVFNLIPLLPLDGGHMAVVVLEGAVNNGRNLLARTRDGLSDWRVPEKAQVAVAATSLSLLLVIFVATAWLDIVSPVQVGG